MAATKKAAMATVGGRQGEAAQWQSRGSRAVGQRLRKETTHRGLAAEDALEEDSSRRLRMAGVGDYCDREAVGASAMAREEEDSSRWLRMAGAGGCCDGEGNGVTGQRRGSGGRRWMCAGGATAEEGVAGRMWLRLWLRREMVAGG
ncbi:hypothetical protein BHE74_00048351 [Ensete ventricosum]|nr:hypothetical protein BHE74_00048351 [Ensete ventricosum]